jgi:hypothetical protein
VRVMNRSDMQQITSTRFFAASARTFQTSSHLAKVVLVGLAATVALGSAGCLNLRTVPLTDADIDPARASGGTGGIDDGTGRGGSPGGGGSTEDAAVVPGAGGSAAVDAPMPAPPPACTVGTTRCAAGAAAVEVCTLAGAWMPDKTCPSICDSGECAGTCTPGDKQCGAGQKPQVCDPQGQWMDAGDPCSNVCSGKGECSGECKPGLKKCGDAPNSLTPYDCDDKGKWIARPSCMNYCSNGSCSGTCVPSSVQCAAAGNKTETCGAMGTWEPGRTCAGQACVNGSCAGSCEPGARQCGANNTAQLCDKSGVWKDDKVCAGQTCVKGSCVGACEVGAPNRCSPDGKAVQSCAAGGVWTNGDACANGCTGAVCNVCKPNSKTCSGNALRTCNGAGSGWVVPDVDCKVRCDAAALKCIDCEKKAEVCDGLDNDCDGTPDNNVPTKACSPACAGTQKCVNGSYTACGATNTDKCCGGVDCSSKKPAGGSASCNGNQCEITCGAGSHMCNGQCKSDNSVASCGTSCNPCPAPQYATATCSGGTCDFTCPANMTKHPADGNTPGSCRCEGVQHICGGKCVLMGNDSCENCAPCRLPPNGVATSCTSSGKCLVRCACGFKPNYDAGASCVPIVPAPVCP